MYTYLRDINSTDLFLYITLILVCSVAYRRITLGPHTIVGLLCGLALVYYLNERKTQSNGDFVKKMHAILALRVLRADKNTYLSRDTEMLLFLDNYKEYYDYNPMAFSQMVTQVNGMFRLLEDLTLGVQDYNLDYDVIRSQRTEILNTYHSFIHTLPHAPYSIEKYHQGLARLESLVNGYVDEAHRIVVRNNRGNVSVSTKFPYRNHPKWNGKVDHHYDYL